MWKLKKMKQMNSFTKQTHKHRKQTSQVGESRQELKGEDFAY